MSKSGREYFRLGAELYSSLGRVGKKEENSVSTFGRFRLWTSFESSPVSAVSKIYLRVARNYLNGIERRKHAQQLRMAGRAPGG